ncbi:MAG: hypothetical protein ACXV8Q_01485 [Methylobacter sp.]
MPLISISEASELTGKSIPTIYCDIKEGKLSQTDNRIDIVDLIRIYGVFKTSANCLRENDLLHRINADLMQDKEKLYQINELLRHSIAELKQDKEKLYRIIASQQKWLSVETVQNKSTEIAKTNEIVVDKSLTRRLIRKLFFK